MKCVEEKLIVLHDECELSLEMHNEMCRNAKESGISSRVEFINSGLAIDYAIDGSCSMDII